MVDYVENAEDYSLKYNECMVTYDGNVVKVAGFEDTPSGVKMKFCRPDKYDGKKCKVSDELLDLSCIPRAAVNLGSSVLVFNLKSNIGSPAKYRRAAGSGNTEIFDPFKKERELLRSQPPRFSDYNVLQAWADNVYIDPKDALDSVINMERLGAAFSEEYFFAIKYKTNSVMLYRRNNMIAKVDSKNKVILLKPPAHPYAEELEDFGLTVKKVAK